MAKRQIERRVTLQLRTGPRIMEYPSRILDIKPDYIVAESPISESGSILHLETGRTIMIFEQTEGGPATTYTTKVREQTTDRSTGEPLTIMEPPDPPMRVRRFVRQAITSPFQSLKLTTSFQPPRVYDDVRCVNLSAGGILLRVELESPQEANLGDHVVVSFSLPVGLKRAGLGAKREFDYSDEMELFGTVIRKYQREVEAVTFDFIGIEFDEEQNFLGPEGEERRRNIQKCVLFHQLLEREAGGI